MTSQNSTAGQNPSAGNTAENPPGQNPAAGSTAEQIRLRRSVLYMPAANARALEKAKTINADALIFDLEDAVAPDVKELARTQACEAVATGDYGYRELTIRCNSLSTPWGEADLVAAAKVGPSAVVIPKVDSAAELDEVAAVLAANTSSASGPARVSDPSGPAIWAMVETPAGLQAINDIAGHPRVAALVLGTNDLAAELRATITPDRAALVPYLSLCLLAARAAGISVLDGVFNDISDAAGFAAVCQQGATMGFDGKTLIHPSQVEPCNEIFAPSTADLDFHRQVVAAFEQATAAGKGVVTVDGKMIENLHVAQAQRALALAQAISQR